MKSLTLAVTVGAVAVAFVANAAPPSSIVLEVAGVQRAGGAVYASLCRRTEVASMRCGKTVGRKVDAPGTIELRFPEVASDTYMILVFHDVNGNKQLDRNQWGAPSEPSGASGRPTQGRMPSFDDSAFVHSGEQSFVQVQLR